MAEHEARTEAREDVGNFMLIIARKLRLKVWISAALSGAELEIVPMNTIPPVKTLQTGTIARFHVLAAASSAGKPNYESQRRIS